MEQKAITLGLEGPNGIVYITISGPDNHVTEMFAFLQMRGIFDIQLRGEESREEQEEDLKEEQITGDDSDVDIR